MSKGQVMKTEIIISYSIVSIDVTLDSQKKHCKAIGKEDWCFEQSYSSLFIFGFSSTKRLGKLSHPVDVMLVHHTVTPSIKFAGTHLYTWLDRGTVRVECLAQQRNTVTWATTKSQTARSVCPARLPLGYYASCHVLQCIENRKLSKFVGDY